VAVELAIGGEGDVIDIEIEPHADGVGGDQVVDVAGLVERDLGVAGARRWRRPRPPRTRRWRCAAAAATACGRRRASAWTAWAAARCWRRATDAPPSAARWRRPAPVSPRGRGG